MHKSKRWFLVNIVSVALLFPTFAFAIQKQPTSPVTRQELLGEIQIKMDRVQRFPKDQHLAGILLTRANDFSWMTAGLGDNTIVITSEIGDMSLLIMNDGHKYIIGESGKVSRHVHEDLAGLGYECESTTGIRTRSFPSASSRSFTTSLMASQSGQTFPTATSKQSNQNSILFAIRLTSLNQEVPMGRPLDHRSSHIGREQLRPEISEKEMEREWLAVPAQPNLSSITRRSRGIPLCAARFPSIQSS